MADKEVFDKLVVRASAAAVTEQYQLIVHFSSIKVIGGAGSLRKRPCTALRGGQACRPS